MQRKHKRPGPTPPRTSIPATQRTKGRLTWAVLLAVLGGITVLFATAGDYLSTGIGAVLAGIAGYFIGKRMEEEAVR